jgi:hypothetical protein
MARDIDNEIYRNNQPPEPRPTPFSPTAAPSQAYRVK